MQEFNHQPNQQRILGSEFDGVRPPSGTAFHFPTSRLLQEDQRESVLESVGSILFLSLHRATIIGGLEQDPSGKFCVPRLGSDEFRDLVKAAEGTIPLRLSEGGQLEAMSKKLLERSEPVLRTLGIPEANMQDVPESAWLKIRFVPIGTLEYSRIMANFARNTFDGNLALTVAQAQLIARDSDGRLTNEQAFLEMADHAIRDAGLDLKPILDLLNTDDDRFVLKAIAFQLLRKVDVSPDAFFGLAEHLARVAPESYFSTPDASEFIVRGKFSGFRQLMYETALFATQSIAAQETPTNLAEAQRVLDVLQFFDDLSVLMNGPEAAIRTVLNADHLPDEIL